MGPTFSSILILVYAELRNSLAQIYCTKETPTLSINNIKLETTPTKKNA